MIFIALAVAWALSDASRLKPVAWSPRVQVIALFFDLRGSSQWAHEAAKGDFIYVKAFLDELRDSATNKANIGLSGRLKLIKFLGDGFLFVWEIPDASVSGSSRKIVRMAHELCVAYRTLAKGPTPSDKFPWGVPAGIGYGIDVGPAIRLTFENGSDDYLGEPLNLAAKMQDLARPAGGGVIQKRVWSLLDEELKAKFPKENTMQIGTQTFTVRMTEEVEYKNHRAKK
jgi:class 3 adenylate cyclase